MQTEPNDAMVAAVEAAEAEGPKFGPAGGLVRGQHEIAVLGDGNDHDPLTFRSSLGDLLEEMAAKGRRVLGFRRIRLPDKVNLVGARIPGGWAWELKLMAVR